MRSDCNVYICINETHDQHVLCLQTIVFMRIMLQMLKKCKIFKWKDVSGKQLLLYIPLLNCLMERAALLKPECISSLFV